MSASIRRARHACRPLGTRRGGSGLEKRIHRLGKRIDELEQQRKGSGQVHRLPDGMVIIEGTASEVRTEVEVVPDNPK